jgi:hypothetical protein
VPHPNLLLDPAITALELSPKQHESRTTTQPHIRQRKGPQAPSGIIAKAEYHLVKMPSAKFTQTYEKITKMGEKLKAAGKQGPSNDEQLKVRLSVPICTSHLFPSHLSPIRKLHSPAPHRSPTFLNKTPANTPYHTALRLRQSRPRPRLQRRKEARHVRSRRTFLQQLVLALWDRLMVL